jgi:aryl carrier-like protein
MAIVLEWNGTDMPPEIRGLPAGRYVIEALDEPSALTPDDDAAIQQGLDSIRRGRAVSAASVKKRIAKILKK